jgi:hypothetical protein
VCKVLLQVDRYWNKVLFRSFQEFVLADQVLCVNHFAGNCDSFHSRCYRKLQARSWFLSIENVSRCTWGLFWEIAYQEVNPGGLLLVLPLRLLYSRERPLAVSAAAPR